MTDRPEYYQTLSRGGESLYKEKGSKFLGFAYFVKDEEDVRDRLEELKKTFHDARHHCYAYVLGEAGDRYRANDDGEPNHSAGDPILGQIRSQALTHTLVVVVRYFGGTKLGVSGLINAYKTAAEDALNNATSITVSITETVTLHYEYTATNEVMRLIDEFELEIITQQFEAKCLIEAKIMIGKVSLFKKKVQLLIDTGHKVVIAL